MSKDIELYERVVTIEASASAAHKRIDTIEKNHGREIILLRETRHEHSGVLQNHTGILGGITKSITNLDKSIEKWGQATHENSKANAEFKAMGKIALWIFGVIGTLITCISATIAFIGGDLMGWW